jgi:predicted transcriptional regulator
MVTSKKDIIELIEKLPDDASAKEIMYEIYLRERVKRGLKDAREGRSISHEELLRDVAEWRKSAGQ